MLAPGDVLAWFQRLEISEQTRTVISHIRSSGPSRRVGGGRSNVTGRYPSSKMGVTIQFESHRVELAGVYEMEHDAGVLEYFDQPPTIKLDYESPAGKRMGVLHTPDFFVIREKEAGWEEWKTEEDLRRLSERNSNRYCTGERGHWRCPPGVAYAEGLGLYYRVRSSAEIDWVFQRNIQFLEDYLRASSQKVSPASRAAAVACVSEKPGLPLDDLLQLTKDSVSSDGIFAMIAADALYVDWRAAPLAEPSRVKVFSTPESASITTRDGSPRPALLSIARLQCGSQITWDGRLWSVVNLGETSVSLLSEHQRLTELPVTVFESLIRENRMQLAAEESGLGSAAPISDRLSRASEADLKVATYRSGFIGRYLDSGTLPAGPEVPKRTFLRWLGRYRKAEATCGSGFLGLLPQCGNRGNRTTKLPETSRRLMQECIDRDYETLKQKTRYVSWAQLKLTCETQATPTPSYKTFCLAVRQRPASDQVLKRKGRRASYQLDVFSWELDVKTPRHGDRPFEIGHMDHTELDVECVTASGQALGRPWLTLLTDSFSRRTLAFYLTFDPPSYRSCMMVLRICVRWCEAFRQVEGETVPVRYDPFDAGTAYAFVQRQWLQCHSDCYGTLKGRSEREIMLATTELHRKHHNHSAGFAVTARHLAEFLQSVEAEEILLTQRLRDREQRAIRSEITTHSENSDVVGEQRALAGSTEHVAPTADDRTIGELYGEF